MKENRSLTAELPIVVKYIQDDHSGMISHRQDRYGIGYIINGSKYIYDGDRRTEVVKGDLFYLGPGQHYIENVPENGKAFEQITFYYTIELMTTIVTHLHTNYHMDIVNDHNCDNCNKEHYVAFPAWKTIRTFFNSVNQYYSEGFFAHNHPAENIKLIELVYLILSNRDCCIKGKVLSSTDTEQESFEQIIHKNIFNRISIDELAHLCNMSLTTFKKEFSRHFTTHLTGGSHANACFTQDCCWFLQTKQLRTSATNADSQTHRISSSYSKRSSVTLPPHIAIDTPKRRKPKFK